ncbi:MAG: 1-phosphofructokinase [Candidatus Izemoplasmataceae bacterium]
MIYTCTLNPALDYRIDLSEYVKYGLNRAKKTSITPGGKGINVSIVLKRLDRPSITLGFEGGFTGRFLKDYLKEVHGLKPEFINVKDHTRINVKIAEENCTKETEVNGPAPKVSDSDYERLIKKIRTLDQNDLLVLAGSDIDKRFNSYQTIASICSKRRVPFIVDSEEGNVTSILKYGPLLLKPNIHELEAIENRPLETKEAIVAAGRRLVKDGARHVIISMGNEGSYFISESKVYHSKALKGTVVNTVGAGDSMVAGFIDGYMETKDPYHAYKKSIAAGSATAFNEGFADKKDIDALMRVVEIREVE